MGQERKKGAIMTIPQKTPFNTYHGRYEAWFTRYEPAYHSELLAFRAFYLDKV